MNKLFMTLMITYHCSSYGETIKNIAYTVAGAGALYGIYYLGYKQGEIIGADTNEQDTKKYFDALYRNMYYYIARRKIEALLDNIEELLEKKSIDVNKLEIDKPTLTAEDFLAQQFSDMNDIYTPAPQETDPTKYSLRYVSNIYILQNDVDKKKAILVYDPTAGDSLHAIVLFMQFGITSPMPSDFKYSKASRMNRSIYKNALLECIAKAKQMNIYLADDNNNANVAYLQLLSLLQHVYTVDAFESMVIR